MSKSSGTPEHKFDTRETISEPVSESTLRALPRDPVIALRFHGGKGEVLLDKDKLRFTVGAGIRCDVVAKDAYASTEHCVLERRDLNRLIVRDLSSKNGTFLNNNRIERAELRVGSVLMVGKTSLVAVGARSRGETTAYERLRGNDPAFREAVELAITGASSKCSVLIVGETGTGKELIARAVHEASKRAAKPFVAINCGAIPRELIGSELFGHEKGAFTGAMNRREGVFMQANGGTLFLDELGELPLEQQPQLLRVLETRRVKRIGGEESHPLDVRIVAATNRLDGLGTSEGKLRPDLYHRIATIVVALPSLRERPQDIPMLVRGFMSQLATESGPRTISKETLRILQGYNWPGNVRELQHAVQRAVALCPRELVASKLLPQTIGGAPAIAQVRGNTVSIPLPAPGTAAPRTSPAQADELSDTSTDDGSSTDNTLSVMETLLRDAMLAELWKHGSIRKAAAALGMPKSTFADRARRYGIKTGSG